MRLLPLLLLLTAACSGGTSSARPQVVAAAYPFAWVAEQVAGPDADVTDLVKPGAEPHDVELSPRQVGTLQEADVVVFLSGFQPAVDDALGDRSSGLDLGKLVRQQDGDEGGLDPHVWLDPQLLVAPAQELGARLAATDPAHAAGYRTRAAAVVQQLGDLDEVFRTSLQGCARRDLVTSHAAFGYLARRYDLVQRGISGLSPEAEPSPKRLAEVARYARDHGVTTIFFESLVDPKVARTVADEIGARTAVLDPVEGVAKGDDYLTVQRRNAAALSDALGCT